MPVPLLFVPLAASAAAATTYSTGAVVGIAIGASVGGAGATAGGVAGWWYFWKKRKTPPQTHEELLRAQHAITQQHIADVDRNQTDLAHTTHAAIEATTNTLLAAAQSTDKLKQTAEVLIKTSAHLERTTQTANEAGEFLQSCIPALDKLSSSLHETTEKTKTTLNELGDHLEDACVVQMTEDVKILTLTINTQADDLTRLSESAKVLSHENEELKSTIAGQSTEIACLKKEVLHTQQNLQFFKTIAQTAMTQQRFPAASLQQSH